MAEFEEYINKIREETRYDPRKKLIKDSKLWYVLLNIAERKDSELYNIFHGLRCVGARLIYQKNGLVLRPGKDIKNDEVWQEYRKEWLFPYADRVKELFGDVEAYIKERKSKK